MFRSWRLEAKRDVKIVLLRRGRPAVAVYKHGPPDGGGSLPSRRLQTCPLRRDAGRSICIGNREYVHTIDPQKRKKPAASAV